MANGELQHDKFWGKPELRLDEDSFEELRKCWVEQWFDALSDRQDAYPTFLWFIDRL